MKKPLTALVAVTVMTLIGTSFAQAGAGQPERAGGLGRLGNEQREARLDHSKELLGAHYKKSVVRSGEKVAKVNGSIYRWTREALTKKHVAKASKIAQAIIDEAHRNGFDPVFLMSVIMTESSFNPEQIGGVGEIGLMQIRPETAEWICGKMNLPWKGKKSLRDPVTNIRIGAAYLAYVREKFDSHARLYLAAYNMGPRNVNELREEKKWPKEYPSKVMKNYVEYYEQLKERAKSSTPSGRNLAKN